MEAVYSLCKSDRREVYWQRRNGQHMLARCSQATSYSFISLLALLSSPTCDLFISLLTPPTPLQRVTSSPTGDFSLNV